MFTWPHAEDFRGSDINRSHVDKVPKAGSRGLSQYKPCRSTGVKLYLTRSPPDSQTARLSSDIYELLDFSTPLFVLD